MSGPEPSPSTPSLAQFSLYQFFRAERDEILKHKWLESQKAGFDVGFEFALTDWMLKHRAQWKREQFPSIPERPESTD